jgi:hypothetical protein
LSAPCGASHDGHSLWVICDLYYSAGFCWGEGVFQIWSVLFLPYSSVFNPLNAKWNPICHLLAFAAAPYIYDISRLRVNLQLFTVPQLSDPLITSMFCEGTKIPWSRANLSHLWLHCETWAPLILHIFHTTISYT